ncbi:MAG TPA: hypothetical protein EYP06_00955, partial [Desulfobacterales bacterium]|nr:hypothetical protein [Desulfobacterales bacterium]
MSRWVFIFPPSVDPTTPPLSLARIRASALSHLAGRVQLNFLDENRKFSRYAVDLVLSSDMENWLKEALERPLPAQFKGYVAR